MFRMSLEHRDIVLRYVRVMNSSGKCVHIDYLILRIKDMFPEYRSGYDSEILLLIEDAIA